MNLYHIFQNVNYGYYTFSDAIVVAASAEEARKIHPSTRVTYPITDPVYDPDDRGDWACYEDVQAEFIGTAADNLKEGAVVCAS